MSTGQREARGEGMHGSAAKGIPDIATALVGVASTALAIWIVSALCGSALAGLELPSPVELVRGVGAWY